MLVINATNSSKNDQIKIGDRSKSDRTRLQAKIGSIGYGNWQCFLNVDISKKKLLTILLERQKDFNIEGRNIMSIIGFRLAYLNVTLSYSKGQLDS